MYSIQLAFMKLAIVDYMSGKRLIITTTTSSCPPVCALGLVLYIVQLRPVQVQPIIYILGI